MTSQTTAAGARTAPDPLRSIVSRNLIANTETLECGHSITRPLSLGEFAMEPSKAKRRRCYHCAALAKTGGA
ncbi:hypothetical protein OCAR_5547 [Afipia carboxidovorans OM5]|uniref:hypothetical protein n=1 Tax=Afipia carboxidovorans TaxID=40137 RepID=UPI0001737180|nr:hypothetical protein [Afipia carboxidovorans]ACI92678.1 hypothetical protein OCAR_5547 [Afipia carboxidovorans OM5]